MADEYTPDPMNPMRVRIDAAVAYPLRHSEIKDFRYDTMLDNLEELIESIRADEGAKRKLAEQTAYLKGVDSGFKDGYLGAIKDRGGVARDMTAEVARRAQLPEQDGHDR
jgi:hypothetical protein